MRFEKPCLSLDDHVALLESRGFIVPDHSRAKRYIRGIGYYRFSAYFLPFQQTKDTFISDTTFDSVLDLYIADRKLRLLAMDALERIEVAFKAAISNTMSKSHGSHWFLNEKLFRKQYRNFSNGYNGFIKQIEGLTGKK